MRSRNLMVALALAGCAGTVREARIERFAAAGVSSRLLDISSGGRLTFVNDDARPHQVYSPDCAELSSVPLRPGEDFTAVAPAGPRVCHFQDLLDPLAPSYTGAVKVDQAAADDWMSTNVTP